MYPLISYLKFLLASTNAHGVHSPFVYGYLTRCLHQKKPGGLTATEAVLAQSIRYFSFDGVWLFHERPQLKSKLEQQCGPIRWQPKAPQVAYLNKGLPNAFFGAAPAMAAGGMLVVPDIHKSRERFRAWKQLLQEPRGRVTLDLFHCGVVFFGREQAKEHFTLRT
ncbi:hypothetical protein [Maribacter sp. 2307ULW6-5]|uniref:hypothetical protein n=1 Tax=Maribacter sp. 2307ULW6-5 TaxID=3386275 RepID=UPI0039BD0E0C